MNEIKCTICEADFRASAIEEVPAGVPKCPLCVKDHPKALSRSEIMVHAKNEAATLSEARVNAMIYEILEAAGFKRKVCEKCNEKFFSTSPMQVTCDKCKVKKDEKKKDEKPNGGSK